jgi:hypothetical protein
VTNNAYSEAIKLNYAIFHTESWYAFSQIKITRSLS